MPAEKSGGILSQIGELGRVPTSRATALQQVELFLLHLLVAMTAQVSRDSRTPRRWCLQPIFESVTVLEQADPKVDRRLSVFM